MVTALLILSMSATASFAQKRSRKRFTIRRKIQTYPPSV